MIEVTLPLWIFVLLLGPDLFMLWIIYKVLNERKEGEQTP